MAEARITREQHDGSITLRVAGNFDRPTAEELCQSLKGLDSSEVVIDFSQVKMFSDVAIDVLARDWGKQTLHTRGLAAHQERMFRYLGIDLELRPSFVPDRV
jgi:anti-anti-sigma regulatory factor